MFLEAELPDHVLRGFILSVVALLWVIGMVRMNGLTALSKMTNFDFVATVAVGSLLAGAGQSSGWLPFIQTLAAIAGIFGAQFVLSLTRERSGAVQKVLQNAPMLLMRDGAFMHATMHAARVTEGDLVAKLREANVLCLSKVRAVVLETTGDVSVLHGDDIDETLLGGVVGQPSP